MIHAIAERLFHLPEHGTNVRTELLAGLTTFLTMAYILAVNSAILSSAGMDKGGVLIATALAAFAGSCFMAFFANLPLALAPAMGLNVYFVSAAAQLGSWQFALFAVFLEGIIFLLLSLTKIRVLLFRSIPVKLQNAIGYGIGLFMIYLGIVCADSVGFGDDAPSFRWFGLLALGGLFFTAWLFRKKIRAAILLGILFTWGAGIICQITGLYEAAPAQGFQSLIPEFSCTSFGNAAAGFREIAGAVFDVSAWQGGGNPAVSIWKLLCSESFLTILFSLLFLDVFSALGTLTGLAREKSGTGGAFAADALSTPVGAVLGTGPVTTYIESAAGITAGGRTGLTALTAGFLFLPAILFAPVFLALPAFAVAPALVIVGFSMSLDAGRQSLKDRDAIPVFLTIGGTAVGMSTSGGITVGIGLGIISWTVLNLLTGHRERVSRLLMVLSLIFLAKFILDLC